MQKLNLTLALAAGLLGGLVSRSITLPSVHAQAQPATPVEIRGQRFTLVDGQDKVVGTFTFRGAATPLPYGVTSPTQPGAVTPQPSTRPVAEPGPIVLLDRNGREIWSSEPFGLKLLSNSPR
jgi:hypothetical protein